MTYSRTREHPFPASDGLSSFLVLSVTYLVKLQKIVSHTDQCPLALYFLQPAQKKLPESTGLLDLPEHRLNDTFSSRVNRDRKSTRLNSSHTVISYAVFCLKKKKKKHQNSR